MLVFLMFLIYFWDFQWWKYLGLAAYDSDPGGSFCLTTGLGKPLKTPCFLGGKPIEDDWSEEKKIQIELTGKHVLKNTKKNIHLFFHKFMDNLITMMSCQALKKNHLFTKYLGTKRPRTIEPEIHWGQVVEAVVPWCIRTCSAVTLHVAKLPEVSSV